MASLIRSMTFAAAVVLLALPAAWSQEQGKARARGADGPEGRRKGAEVHPQGPGGQGASLDELLKKGKVALVFYRSADW